jgi:hypothetical protein
VRGKLVGANKANYVIFGERVFDKLDRGMSIVMVGCCNDVSKSVIC